MRKGLILSLFLIPLFSVTRVSTPVTLSVTITNIRHVKGKLWIAIFRPNEKFEGRPGIYRILPVALHDQMQVKIELEPGKYALAVYHDLNGNNELDKNFIGIPKEPYGFSNNFRPRFSPPKFEDCAFDVAAAGNSITVKLTD
ncbi:hypothetical protein DYBT9275_04010 [Dyadobacter sp. CECT 9275]|uniref:DUF2141 domain-containing protein n=1 Tax=Dyadobacter helix TaxID=2822344 RepID=A0A916JEH5_9BACT|nr:DUF2141 domain-containing protein [Dyadobacter sp. CECT 9275]CAG5007275.1 hypothetical protein DYBT9275_04010 [Dyadobacter sp. CECT 9275]